jgi:hypothetical protein
MEPRSRKFIALSRLISASIAVSILVSLGGPLVTSFAADPAQRVPRSVDVIPRPTDLSMGLAQVQYKGYFADNTNWFTNERYSSSVMGNTTTSASGLPVFDGSSDLGGQTSFSWTGYFIPDISGEWEFLLESDDASYLWIGNDAIVNYQNRPDTALISNGGIYAALIKSGKINLIKDKIYPLRIQYGNDTNAAVFKFRYKAPGFTVYQGDFLTLLWKSSGGGYANNCTNFGLSYTLVAELGYDNIGIPTVCKNNGNDPNYKNTWVVIKPENRTPRNLSDIPRPDGSLTGLHEAKFPGYLADNPELLKGKAASQVAVRTTLPFFRDQSFSTLGQNTYMWSGYLVPDATGEWTFKINSDDAAYMWLGNEAIQNWMDNLSSAQISIGGIHEPRFTTKTITLKKDDVYPIRVLYGNWASLGTFNFEFLPPGFSTYQTNSTGLFFHSAISYCTNWGISYILMPKYGYDQVVPNSNCKDNKPQSVAVKSKPQTPTITSLKMTSAGLTIEASIGSVEVSNIYLLSPSIGYSSASKLAGKISGDLGTFLIPISRLKNVTKIDINLFSSNDQGLASTTRKAVPVVISSKSPTPSAKPTTTKKSPTPKSVTCSKGDKSRNFLGNVCPPGWSK